MASRQWVAFSLNHEHFCIDITQVGQIIAPREIFKVPNTPDYVEGLINLRGEVFTIFNMRKKFHMPPAEFDDSTKIIIVHIGSTSIGLIVDQVNEIISVEDSQVQTAPDTIRHLDKKYISGIVKRDESITFILDVELLLAQ